MYYFNVSAVLYTYSTTVINFLHM